MDDGVYPFYIRSDVPVRSNKYLYDCEAVIIIGDGNIGKVFHYVNGKFDLHQRCYKMADFKDVLGKYFYYFFSTRFYDRAMKITAKATVDSVRLEMISEMDICFPRELDEQNLIAEFFSHLDNLITLHQRKSLVIVLNIFIISDYFLHKISIKNYYINCIFSNTSLSSSSIVLIILLIIKNDTTFLHFSFFKF